MVLPRLAVVLSLAVASTAGCGRELEAPKPASVLAEPKAAAPVAAAPGKGDLIEGRVEPTAPPAPARAGKEYEHRVADARRTVDITLYGATWCPSCRQARAWLDANGMAYSERDIDRSEDASRTMRKLNPAGTIPVIDVEGEVVVGFAPEAVDRAIRRKAERRVQMN